MPATTTSPSSRSLSIQRYRSTRERVLMDQECSSSRSSGRPEPLHFEGREGRLRRLRLICERADIDQDCSSAGSAGLGQPPNIDGAVLRVNICAVRAPAGAVSFEINHIEINLTNQPTP